MNDLQSLITRVPSVAQCSECNPYLLLRAQAGPDSGVDADVEWVLEEGSAELRIGVTERREGNREVVCGAVFDAGAGRLVRWGRSVSLASTQDVADAAGRAAAMQELALLLSGTAPVGLAIDDSGSIA